MACTYGARLGVGAQGTNVARRLDFRAGRRDLVAAVNKVTQAGGA
jgi:hypothetical protein